MKINLVVIYTDRLEECRDFYAGLGLRFVPEKHGSGPDHYAATLADGSVFELYPTGRRSATGYMRLGLDVPRGAGDLAAGRTTLTDPDGRTVVATVAEDVPGPTAHDVREAVRRVLGDSARATVETFSAGTIALTVHIGTHTATIDGHPATGYGWTLDPGEDGGFTGHANQAETLDDALHQVRAALG